MNKYSYILLPILAAISTAATIRHYQVTVQPALSGVEKFLQNYQQYQIQIGVGDQLYPISQVAIKDDSLTIYYSGYNNGYESGTIDNNGNFVGTFKTDVSEGTVKMQFKEDGTATGAWLLSDEWIDFYNTSKAVYGMGYGPNNIQKKP